MIQAVVFDTKPYDRGALQSATPGGSIEWRFLEFGMKVLAHDPFPNRDMTGPRHLMSQPYATA